ncbi:antirestriction protein ArdA [Pseudactinotalea sp. HY158]|uniref:antirestriction protein ArdA n=1 Tax=Pseudactinotalea sp. HY158 TaxID=2654547 RepID=UPI00129C49A9|nr:antirestriction protein ArdA [Pseudactinotalea sp. HY158]QGH68682.1 antirestriction protein ArdA [Pseudactinotalea sp. HY158]
MNEHQPPAPQRDPEHEPSREQMPELHPRVWIGSLADYTSGTLHGDWVDAATSDEELLAAAQRVLASSELPDAEEWAIFDSDEFGSFEVGEHDDLALVARVARGIREHGPAYACWAQLHDGDEAMCDAFTDAFLGEYDTPGDWVRSVIDEADIDQHVEQAVGANLARYIHFDADGFAQDAWLAGDIHLAERTGGGYWVFATNV